MAEEAIQNKTEPKKRGPGDAEKGQTPFGIQVYEATPQ